MDLGVTNIIDAASGGRQLSHAIYNILSSWYHCIILACNMISRTMIIVVPPGVVNVGTMNNMLFPPPVGITATMGLSPYWMACMARS